MPLDEDKSAPLPQEPIDRLVKPIARFLHVEAASGVVLLLCAATAIVLANSPWSEAYLAFWKTKIGITAGDFEFRHSLKHLINDGLMVIFFFVIGLEVKREIVLGELSDLRRAALPIAAALGGMILPALLFISLQIGQPGLRGWGIPMATDIAFVVGCMAVLGKRVPHSLRVLLLSLAIADDIGAILVIAVGYTSDLNWMWLALAAFGLLLTALANRVGVRNFPTYTALALFVWFCFHESGVHATIAGVIIGMMTPTRAYVPEGAFSDLLRRADAIFEGENWSSQSHRPEKLRKLRHAARETVSPLEYLENTLHPWTSFVIMPIFALANAGVPIEVATATDRLAIAVMVGLIVGKPLGILLFSWLGVKLKLAELPQNISWPVMAGGGCLAGIGFTMALFIAELALSEELLDTAKIGVLIGSLLSAVLGMSLLVWLLPKPTNTEEGQ